MAMSKMTKWLLIILVIVIVLVVLFGKQLGLPIPAIIPGY